MSFTGPSYGAAAADFDQDGWPDLAVSHHGRVQVWRNHQDGTFLDVDPAVFEFGDTHGVSWLDVDRDGWLDLYVAMGANRGQGSGENRVYLNRSGQGFQLADDLPDVLSDPLGRGRCSAVHDLDGDGRLDVLVLNAPTPGRENRLALHRAEDLGSEASARGEWRESFVDESEASGLKLVRAECATVLYLDMASTPILLAYGSGRDSGHAYRRAADGRLRDVTAELGLPLDENIYAAASGDYDNDGDLDLLVVRGHGVPTSIRYRPGSVLFRLAPWESKKVYGLKVRFEAITRAEFLVSGQVGQVRHIRLGAGKVVPERGWTFDRDDPRLAGQPSIDTRRDAGLFLWRGEEGWLSIALVGDGGRIGAASGEISGDLNESMVKPFEPIQAPRPRHHRLYQTRDGRLVDVTKEAGLAVASSGRDAVFFDADNDGDLDLFVVHGGTAFTNLPDVFYMNEGDGTFRDFTQQAGLAGPEQGRGASVLVFDPDRDGDLDLFVTNGEGPASGNEGPDQLWVNQIDAAERSARLDLTGSKASGRSAQGTRIHVRFGDRQLFMVRASTSSRFVTSVVPFHLGLGNTPEARVEILWPSGKREELVIKAGESLERTAPE